MWERHQKLEQHIAAEMENVIVKERIVGECCISRIFRDKDPDHFASTQKAVATHRTLLLK